MATLSIVVNGDIAPITTQMKRFAKGVEHCLLWPPLQQSLLQRQDRDLELVAQTGIPHWNQGSPPRCHPNRQVEGVCAT